MYFLQSAVITVCLRNTFHMISEFQTLAHIYAAEMLKCIICFVAESCSTVIFQGAYMQQFCSVAHIIMYDITISYY